MPTTKSRGRRPPLPPMERARRLTNYIRLLAFAVAAMILMTGIALGVFSRVHLLGVAGLLAYPLIVQSLLVLLERGGRNSADKLTTAVMHLDAAVIGAACAALHFAVIPSLALLIIVHANSASGGGVKVWLVNFLMTVLGAAVTALLTGVPFQITNAPLTLSVLSLVGLGIYVGASSLHSSQQTLILRQAEARLRQQQRQAVELSRKLAKYLPPQVWGSLFTGKRDAKLETRRKRLTVFFSDIKGFSAISEELPLDTLTRMLNTYLSEMTRIAMRHGGTVDKFIGDAVMVFFGDPKSAGAKEDAYRAAAMAIEMQQYMKLLRQRWKREGIKQKLEIRIGINTGHVTVGNFGTDSRMDYTILGTDVNLASRLESACRPGAVLISASTHELIRDRVQCRDVGEIQAKGFSRPIPVFEALDLKRNAGGKRRFISVESAGFGLHLDLERVRNFDKNRVLKALASSASDLRKQSPVNLDFEAEGFALFVDSQAIQHRELDRVLEVLGKTARKIQEQVRM